MRAVVNLALDTLACKDGKEPGYQQKRHQLMVTAMRLRYGLDDNKPRTLKEVSSGASAPLLWPAVCGASCWMLCKDLYRGMRVFGMLCAKRGASKTPCTSQVSCRVALQDKQEGGLCLQVSLALQAEHNSKGPSIETVRGLIEDGKERLALILDQEGLLKELQLSA